MPGWVCISSLSSTAQRKAPQTRQHRRLLAPQCPCALKMALTQLSAEPLTWCPQPSGGNKWRKPRVSNSSTLSSAAAFHSPWRACEKPSMNSFHSLRMFTQAERGSLGKPAISFPNRNKYRRGNESIVKAPFKPCQTLLIIS